MPTVKTSVNLSAVPPTYPATACQLVFLASRLFLLIELLRMQRLKGIVKIESTGRNYAVEPRFACHTAEIAIVGT